MPAQQGRTVPLTGGAGGIGLRTAEAFARRGARVIIGARNAGKAGLAVAAIRSAAGESEVEWLPLDLADLAAGRFDGFWELRLSAWDIAAGMLLIREAGGVVTDFEGRHLGIEHSGVVAGNPAIHRWLLHTLSVSGAPVRLGSWTTSKS